MGEGSKIEWTDHTFNPWIGCTKVSAACRNCYAETYAERYGIATWGPSGTRKRTAASTWAEPRRWNRQAKAEGVKRFVFCASLADVFEARDDLDPIRADLWQLIEECDGLTWLLLTKRPDEICRRVPAAWLSRWPAHVWVGTSVEDQAAADTRIPLLLAVPAPVRFLSMEPLLGPVTLPIHAPDPGLRWRDCCCGEIDPADVPCVVCEASGGIGWVIVGGESGAHARPMHPGWAHSVRDQCVAAGVPFFFKQWGEWAPWFDWGARSSFWPDSPLRRGPQDIGGGWKIGLSHFDDQHQSCGDTVVYRVGKKAAGRLLDGREHNGRPEAT